MRYLIITVITLFAISQAQNSAASSYSQQLVDEGRVLLFGSDNIPPNPTYSGLVAANDKFESAVAADSGDPEANLFYAFTRVLVSYLEQGNTGNIETVRDLLEAVGLTRNLADNVNLSGYNDPPKINGSYVPPYTTPSGEEFQSFLTGDFLSLLDSAVGNLNAITGQSFTTTLTPAETGDIYPIEIDYSDVLLVKSLLYTLKAFIQILSAYDMDIDLREAIILSNADVLQIQRDLLDKYNSFLSLHTDGASSLTSARATLMLAIDTSRSAFNFITSETDDQNDDLISFGSDEEVAEARTALAALTELQNSLNENRPYTENSEYWYISTQSGDYLYLYITTDGQGNLLEGSVSDGTPWYFGWINDLTVVDSNITIDIGFYEYYLCTANFILTGVLSGAQYQNVAGTYIYTPCQGGEAEYGSFSGAQFYSGVETPFDLNYLFGNSGKSPLDIRGILPNFDNNDYVLAGTFPQPYLNNIIPGIDTELNLVTELEIPLIFDVPPGSISGTVSCDSCSSNGKIFIYVYDDNNHETRRLLGSAVLNTPGTYNITGLPIGNEVYIMAHWDADNNGLQTADDFISKVVTAVISSVGTYKDINFKSPVLLPGVMMLLLE